MQNRIYGAIIGAVVGDARGLPFEFKEKGTIKKRHINKPKDLGFFNQPLGTWSDDSSMIFCTMHSMLQGYNYIDIGDTFCKWKYEAFWTPYGILFDIGGTTAKAIMHINLRKDYNGINDENNCGNGSLMRIIPILFYIKDNRDDRFKIIREVSSLTHSNIICVIACSIYLELCLNILDGHEKKAAYIKMQKNIKEEFKEYSNELSLFSNILEFNIWDIDKSKLSGSGYVIHTLESSLYSFMKYNSYSKIIKNVILIGEDTDTTACISGGIAGLYYGYNRIPKKWINSIVKKDEIFKLIEDFEDLYK